MGRSWSDKQRQHHSEFMKLKWKGQKFRLRGIELLTGENNPFYGRKHTEETKLKISNSVKKNPLTEDQRRRHTEKMKDPVVRENQRLGGTADTLRDEKLSSLGWKVIRINEDDSENTVEEKLGLVPC